MTIREVFLLTLAGVGASACAQDSPRVGPLGGGAHMTSSAQTIKPAGKTLEIAGRPVDIVVTSDGKTLYAKDHRGWVVVDAESWTVKQELKFEDEGGSMCGLALTRDNKHLLATTSGDELLQADIRADGTIATAGAVRLRGPKGHGKSFPCGVAISNDGRFAFVCLSRNNTLAIVDRADSKCVAEIPVGIAPYAVKLSADGRVAYVTNWGGRRPVAGDITASSAGSEAIVDARGIASSGTVSIVDLEARQEKAQVDVGLSPSALCLAANGKALFVANSNTDTIAAIDLASEKAIGSVSIRPAEGLPFGSMPNGLAIDPNGQRLYVSLAGNNALAVIELRDGGSTLGAVTGFIPTAWYPGAVEVTNDAIYVANIKGIGARSRVPNKSGWNSHWHRGTFSKLAPPTSAELAVMTRQVLADSRVPQMLSSLETEQRRADAPAAAIPASVGAPSVFEHVVYIIKENRTYDQVFGDMPRGNNDPSLCIYGREITPNQHALAEQFVLLDNFYCNGVLSADGHSWVTEGNVTPYLERSFGGFNRSYTFGNDPLTYSSSGFIWDHVLAKGLSFRNYGEFDDAELEPKAKYNEVWKDWREKAGKIRRKQQIGVANLRKYTCPEYPGWNMDIPDQLRADVFLTEFAEFERNGLWPNFVMAYLPNDHTSGTSESAPTPRALVADNDLALGRIVEAISKSRCWPKTCIFVIEDDPQNGFDHVDGHRSTCLVISPYTKRGAVVSAFYNQASVVHTIERIFGIAPHNQLYALAPLMSECFVDAPNPSGYRCLPSNVPLGEMNRKAAQLTPLERELARASDALDLQLPDRADEGVLNRILWHAAKGPDAEYPAAFAGAHGRGLGRLGLQLTNGGVDDDDD